MDRDTLLGHLTAALRTIITPRFYQNERGFQGELLVRLRQTIPADFLLDEMIIEQEHQKNITLHGLGGRPDIIIHEPYDESHHSSRRDGNHVVIEIKRSASLSRAIEDITSLINMIETLDYPLAIFINIASDNTWADRVPTEWRDRIVCFAVYLQNGEAHVIRSDVG